MLSLLLVLVKKRANSIPRSRFQLSFPELYSFDSQDPSTGKKTKLKNVLDFACGSGSLLINVRKQFGANGIIRSMGRRKNITTYNLARMNMLLRRCKGL